jgi:hypothetical protein
LTSIATHYKVETVMKPPQLALFETAALAPKKNGYASEKTYKFADADAAVRAEELSYELLGLEDDVEMLRDGLKELQENPDDGEGGEKPKSGRKRARR